MNLTIESLGGTETVTGSKHLIKTGNLTILVDCGLFQNASLQQSNWDSLPINSSEIDAIIITHAHLDHYGYLPLLAKSGFRGKIYMTPPTQELIKNGLMDTARITQAEDDIPLYSMKDVKNVLQQFKIVEHDSLCMLSDTVTFRFINNGHILGSCFAEMRFYGKTVKTVVFSGDIGRSNSAYLSPPISILKADYVFMEATYGDRLHRTDHCDVLEKIINDTYKKRGNVLLPAFAVGRTQELMKILTDLRLSKRIPSMPIYVDGVLNAQASDLMQRFPKWHRIEADELKKIYRTVTINRNPRETNRIIYDGKPKIVIAASGMLAGGRVLKYLLAYAPNPKNAIVFTSYQAEGTRGRLIVDGAQVIDVYGKPVAMNAAVYSISGLSAHGDQADILNWLKGFDKKPDKIFLIHGELASMDILGCKIQEVFGIQTEIMQQFHSLSLN